MKTDSLFYRLFQERPGLVFELAEWPLPSTAYTLQAEEVKQTGFRLDGLLLPPPGSPEPLVFVETQFQRDAAFYSRWFAEMFLYLYRRQWHGPWRAVAIFPSHATDAPPWLAHQPLLDSTWVKRVYLEDLTERADLTPGLQLMQLIIAEPAAAISQAQALLTLRGAIEERDWPAWLDLIETILVYKLPRLRREEIQRMVHLPEVELKQTQFYQDVFAEGREEGLAEGRQQGREEGRQQGREEGRQQGTALVLRLLRRRLGAVPQDLESRIRALPTAELETLGEALLDWHTLAELSDWFQQRR